MRASLIGLLLLTGCGYSLNNSQATHQVKPSFQAWGIKYVPGLPIDPFYNIPGTPQYSNPPVYMQPLPEGVLTQIMANFLTPGINSPDYDTVNSSWKPMTKGLYYIDEQATIQATFNTPGFARYYIQLNLAGAPYLWYSDDVGVPANTVVRHKVSINAVMCFNGISDHSEVGASLTGDVETATIISQESQFEGYYLGDCND
jgi:hypothetical protein